MIVSKPIKKKKKKTSRYTVLCIIMGVIFTAIILKLVYLQVYNYQEYKERADVTSTRFIADKAPRGKIYDDKGNILATSRQTYTITYTKTEDADKHFYETMKELFKILDENNETVQDTLPLKIDGNNNIYFEYSSNNKDSQNAEELRFKKDRGLNDSLKNKLFKNVEELSDAQNAQLDQELMKITPEDSFYFLVRAYNMIQLVDPNYNDKNKAKTYANMSDKELTEEIIKQGYSLNDIRRYMVVKDAIKIQSVKGYRSVTIAGNIKKDTSLIVMQKQFDLSGINVSLSPIRDYPYKNLASAVLGYVSSISDTQKEKYELKGYDVSSDLIGQSGIESAFEEQLKGVKGGSTIKVNSQGRKTQTLFELEPSPGNDVHLTIDRDVQYAAEQALADGIQNIRNNTRSDLDNHSFLNATRGALVAVEVKTGRVISLVSYPNFDPNLFAVPGQLTSDQRKQFFSPDLEAFGNEYIKRMGINKTVDDLFPKDSSGNRSDQFDLYPKPVFNYATMSQIPPGSTFKPLTAIAGIESGAITPDTVINDTGEFNIHPEIFGKNFNPGGLEAPNGPTNLTQALAKSINYYFYEIATKMFIQSGGKSDPTESLNALAKYAWQFGLGVDPDSNQKGSTGIEIGESFGDTYNFKAWKNKSITMAKFNLVQFFGKDGSYNGVTFIPLDIQISDNDNKEVEKSKKAIKDRMTENLSKVGTDEKSMQNHDEFAKSVKPDILNIMNNSDVYKQNVAAYEARTGRKVNLESQASIIAEQMAQFTINDKPGEMKTPGEIVHASIGQGMDNFTPLQLVSYISTLANGGTRYKLHLVDKITDNNGNVVQDFKPEVLNTVSISQGAQNAVREGMKAVNSTEEGGTSSTTFANFPIQTAGKTGTADSSQNQREIGRDPYATYVSYAPADNPEIAVVAVVFDGGHGSNIASAVKAVYEAYFKDRLLQKDPNYASKSESFKKYVVDNPYNKTAATSQQSNASTGSASANTKTN
ncbi:penicillin-binding transpeptidase domain-containing protein [Clostridium saccharoperbutylacetonicum]|uniref:penicillin-binding transpeptidase domain-containing protein n=1 Tax=Clostridium saccharoperbutylacetonicum TaxID=36745 RepID=UPI000983F9AB|nr:penicillin-binding transpeptidase domain-containing protein [Clostridium saccharoperbutylacetonicum]AQR97653.1 penicillin-binding protein 2B [Clostridium saccharoperbutylacetonicum]NSB33538.1 penicillin-binding protein 2 [Clostridium saccharoperbutylacetonicum]